MLPKLIPEQTIEPIYEKYVKALKKTAIKGEIKIDYASRLAVATDNSVYQLIPQAIFLPKTTQDIFLAIQLAQQDPFTIIKFVARGGGTGTNGQALTSGIVIDVSRYMHAIIETNINEAWVRVQPGIVLDQLNSYLKPFGVYFAPEISPSNRATVGGMINTDACGNGSKALGRTSDHVLGLQCVLSDAKIINTENEIYLKEKINGLVQPKYELIQEKFIARPRNLNGYNLLKATDLNYLFSGSEGTLGIITECKLKLTPLPQYKKLILLKYRSFDDALRTHHFLSQLNPLVIEAIDEKLVALSRQDPIYFRIEEMMDGDVTAGAISLVEFVTDNEEQLNITLKHLSDLLNYNDAVLGYYMAQDEVEAKLIWELRKKSVGLISKRLQGQRRPIPFIEDTAVPPEKLADYIADFKILLDKHQLTYGMYGHVDAGCVHVRPALDLKQESDELLFQTLSNEVAELVKKYNGVMWGEHGMGFRTEYAETFFGSELYHIVKQIKTLFDPINRFNPGKIVVPLTKNDSLVNIAGPFRAKQDKQISEDLQHQYPTALACNGNGACFSYVTQEVMCPSFKVTQHRLHSPKGRATVMREWLRLISINKSNFFTKLINITKRNDFSKEVFEAMHGCLSCKACTNQCPLNVNIPEMKVAFLNKYYQRYYHSIRDYLVAYIEYFSPLLAKFSWLINLILQSNIANYINKHLFKLEDLPIFVKPKLDSKLASISKLVNLNPSEKLNAVILLQDSFTSFNEENVIESIYTLLTKMGIKVYMLPYFPNGKPLHIHGFLKQFTAVAKKNIDYLRIIASFGIPMVGVDPSITLTYRDEYRKIVPDEALGFEVQLLQEWLYTKKELLPKAKIEKHFYIIAHCTEKTACVSAEKLWQDIFIAAGHKLTPLAAGCCGMAGSYGHETEHVDQSKRLFNMDWQYYLDEKPDESILATGYSCRSQVKRCKKLTIKHPIEVLM